MKFKLNDWVAYPGHGIGQIIRAEVKEVFGKTQEFFTIQFSNGMKLMLPSANVEQVGLRKVLTKGQINKAFVELKDVSLVSNNNWNARYRTYMGQLKTGEFIDVITVLKQLNFNKGQFELSFGERKLLDEAMTLAVKEISLAYGMHELKAKEIITEKLR